jgi:DnaJ-class molecular chaperone
MEIKNQTCPMCLGSGNNVGFLALSIVIPCNHCGGTGQIKTLTSKEQDTPLQQAK